MDLGSSERLPVGDLVNTVDAAGGEEIEGFSFAECQRISRPMISNNLITKWEREISCSFT